LAAIASVAANPAHDMQLACLLTAVFVGTGLQRQRARRILSPDCRSTFRYRNVRHLPPVGAESRGFGSQVPVMLPTRSKQRYGASPSTADIETAVLKAANLGDDADTTAAIAG
jgi:hypothetical protein